MEKGSKGLDGILKGKGCFRQILIMLVILLFGWYAWGYFSGGGSLEDITVDDLFPQKATGEIDTSDWLTFSSTTGTDFSLKYSQSWDLFSETEGRNEFSYFRSPKDENGFYLCLNLKEYFSDYDIDLDMTANVVLAEDFAADGIGKPLNHIVYESPDLMDLHFSVIDDTTVAVGDSVDFTESIVNPFGWRLMIQAGYNCDEPEPPTLELEDFESSLSVQEALLMLHTLRY